MNDNKRMEEIRNDWFKDHKAKIVKLSEQTSVLSWKKEGTINYSVRYIFDLNHIFVSGDLGEGVFCLTEKAELNKIADYSIHYIMSKLRADSGAYDFDSEKAIQRFKEDFNNEMISDLGLDEEEAKKYRKLILDFCTELREECDSLGMLNHLLSSEYYDRISEFDPDCWEWIYKIGKEISWQTLGWLVGLEMAYEQLSGEIEVEK